MAEELGEPTILEVALQSMLAAVEGSNGAYPLYSPQDARTPYFLYGRVDTERDFTLQGPSGLADARMEITAYAPGYVEALTLAGKARQALDGFLGTVEGVDILACRLDTDSDVFVAETDPKLFGVPAFYLISYREI